MDGFALLLEMQRQLKHASKRGDSELVERLENDIEGMMESLLKRGNE